MNSNLTYLLSKVQSVSTQTFKLNPQNSTSATPNDTIRISLPSNTLLNTRSLKLMFTASTAGAGTGGRLPAKIESLIESVRLEAGGVTIDGSGFDNYGVLCHAKDALMGGKSSVLSHPEIVREKSYHNGAAAMAAAAVEAYAANNDFAVSFDLGFMGSCEPSIIDTSLLPDLVLVIGLAGKEVLSNTAGVDLATFVTDGASDPSFSLSNIRCLAECIGLGSGVYDQLVSRAISERGSIEVPFKQYFSTINTHNGSTRFHVSSASLDRIWAVFRDDDYATVGAPVPVKGYKKTGGFIAAASGDSPTTDIGLPDYDAGGVLRTNGEKYVGKYHNFEFGSAAATLQFQLNGSLTPGWSANIPEWLEMSRCAVDHQGEPEIKTLDQYRNNYAVICHRLSLPGSGTRELSGVDTRSISLQASLNTNNVAANSNCVIFCECTSVLQIGANKQFSVVV